MDLVRRIHDCFLRISESALDFLEDEFSYAEFEIKLQKELNEAGKQICQFVLEAADEHIKQNVRQRKGWVVQRKGDPKRVISPFGEVNYQRTYYRHKDSGEYAYLLDQAIGLEPHSRIDLAARASLIEWSSDVSYRTAGKELGRNMPEGIVSGQTVLNTIRKLSQEDTFKPKQAETARRANVLHIQADEDHIKSQDGSTLLGKLVYITEGYKGEGKRKELKEIYHIAGVYENNYQLCYEVMEYLEKNYDFDEIEAVYVYGDGAPWIRQLQEYLPKSVFVLDRYHINKAVLKATGSIPTFRHQIWSALNRCDLKGLKAAFRQIGQAVETEYALQAVAECRKYLVNNWDGIEAWKRYSEQVIGCSAEGHVSHVLSSRMSSRPMAWSKVGADQMAKLRALKANGVSLRNYLIKENIKGQSLIEIGQKVIKTERERLKKASGEMYDNIPSLRVAQNSLNRFIRRYIRPVSVLELNYR